MAALANDAAVLMHQYNLAHVIVGWGAGWLAVPLKWLLVGGDRKETGRVQSEKCIFLRHECSPKALNNQAE